MPQYDINDVKPLIDLLIRADGLDPEQTELEHAHSNRDHLDQARFLIGRTGLNCVGCHDFADHRGVGVRAPDLATAAERLRFNWFRRWLHNPQQISPGTRMPSNFNGGISALPNVLGGREATQVDAIWSYLGQKEDRQPPLVPALTRAKAQGVESDTPQPIERPMVRFGFLPNDAGLRAIALGFPANLHFAWDSSTCRLARVWSGGFIHQAGWEGSGKGGVSVNAMSIMRDVIWKDDLPGPIQLTDRDLQIQRFPVGINHGSTIAMPV